MSYIGNSPISIAFLVDTFSGTGSQTAFTMTVAPANTSSIIVAVTGVLQDPSTYSVSGTTLTFSAAPPSGTSNISVRYLGIPASGVTTTAYRTVTDFTATAAQTSFSVPSYTVGYIDVYRNGVRLVSTDFTATTGTTVVLVNACTSGDSVVTESFLVSSVLNAIPATAASISLTSATYLSGILPVAYGGTGVATSTGSGAVVLATSPTITTPVISSLSSASATSLTLQSAGTNGVIIDTSQNLQFNSGYGSVATAYGCRAWVNFNGTGTVAIRASANVSSITDNATGLYTVNYTNALPDVNYSVSMNMQPSGDPGGGICHIGPTGLSPANYSTTATTIRTAWSSAAQDPPIVVFAAFR